MWDRGVNCEEVSLLIDKKEEADAKVVDGRKIASSILASLESKFANLRTVLGRSVCLLGIECGLGEDSRSYIRAQQSAAKRLGIEYRHRQVAPYQSSVEEAVLMANSDPAVDGVILHTPFPEGVDVFNALRLLSANKDVEGLSPNNVFGMFFRQENTIFPPTPRAVLRILDEIGVEIRGKRVVVVGEGAVVGRPLSIMFLQRGATVVTCHLPTYERGDLPSLVNWGEIVVSAVGKAGLIRGEWIREGAVVIDVGINFVGERMVGDVAFEEVLPKVRYVTPVPGGVGPVTTAILMENLYLLVSNNLSRRERKNED